MTALSFIVELAIKTTVLLAAAAALTAAMRARVSAAARHLVWTTAIAGTLVLPIVVTLGPSWTVLRLPIAAARIAEASAPAAAASDSAPLQGVRNEGVGVPSSTMTGSDGPLASAASSGVLALSWPMLLGAIYLSGVLLLSLRRVVERLALVRLARSTEAPDPSWRRALEQAATDLGYRVPVRLLVSSNEVLPLTYGTRHPTVIVPSAEDWTDDRRRAVLLHELAHIERRDCLTQTIASVACAIYWPQPLVWIAARRLRIERELACDDRVLAAGTEAGDYAGHLLDIARTFTHAPEGALAMARPSQLEGRLLAVLDAARNRAGLGRDRRLVAVVTSAAVIFSLGALRAAALTEPPALLTISNTGAMGSDTFTAPAGFQQSRANVSSDFTGSWEVRPAQKSGDVQFTMRGEHWSSGTTVALSRFEGLTTAQISSSGPVHFASRREAGTFTFEGTCTRGVCAGTYAFSPDAAFASKLAQRGLGTPTPEQEFRLARADVGLAFVDELKADGYAPVTVDLLVRASDHGVTLDYLRGMTGLGYRLGDLDSLIRMRDHGVDLEYVRGMADNGLSKIAAEDLVKARDHGVDPKFVRGLADAGFKDLPLSSLIVARDHGVDPNYASGMRAGGYRVTLDELRTARDHGVDPNYVRGLADLGYKDVPLASLIKMRDHGVDANFVKKVQSQGVGHLDVEELIRRRDRGGN